MTTIPVRQILCPVDRSETAHHAGLRALAFARSTGAQLTFLHVVPPLRIPTGEPAVWIEQPPLEQDERPIRSWMSERFGGASAGAVTPQFLIRVGVPAKEVLACAAALNADLIVIGTHGTGGFERLMLGSVTEKVLRQALCAVLTVPPHDIQTSSLPFARVLCAIDFSECSLHALEFAMTTALDSGALLMLAHVLEWPWEEPPAPAFDELPPVEAAALGLYRRQRERTVVARLRALEPEGLAERCELRVVHGRSYTEILRLAATERADLVVLGVRGRSAVDLAVFGSTTNQVVRHATCPVLTIKH